METISGESFAMEIFARKIFARKTFARKIFAMETISGESFASYFALNQNFVSDCDSTRASMSSGSTGKKSMPVRASMLSTVTT